MSKTEVEPRAAIKVFLGKSRAQGREKQIAPKSLHFHSLDSYQTTPSSLDRTSIRNRSVIVKMENASFRCFSPGGAGGEEVDVRAWGRG